MLNAYRIAQNADYSILKSVCVCVGGGAKCNTYLTWNSKMLEVALKGYRSKNSDPH